MAALPLVKQKLKKFIPVYGLPNNEWGRWGELLIHPDFDGGETYAQLAVAIGKATGRGIQLDGVCQNSRQWSQFIGAMRGLKRNCYSSFAYHVGIIQNDVCWSQFQSRLSSGFRKKLRRYSRGLEQLGAVSFEQHFRFAAGDTERFVERAFEVEQGSWKSQQGSSVIASGQFEFYLQQARLLAAEGHLRISFLRLDDRIVAFEFGALGKQTYYSWKIGYESQYAKFAPGQLLAQYITRSFHDTGDCVVQDTVGPISQATEKWITDCSPRVNVTFSGTSPAAIVGHRLVQAARFAKKFVHPDKAIEPPVVIASRAPDTVVQPRQATAR